MFWTNKWGWVWIGWMSSLVLLGCIEVAYKDFSKWWLIVYIIILVSQVFMVRIK